MQPIIRGKHEPLNARCERPFTTTLHFPRGCRKVSDVPRVPRVPRRAAEELSASRESIENPEKEKKRCRAAIAGNSQRIA